MPPTTFTLSPKPATLTTQESIEPLTKPLILSQTHTHISLSGNTLGVPAATYLSTLLPPQTHLQSADLADIFTGRLLSEIPQALTALLTALLQCQKLEHINLSDNAFGLNTVEPLTAFLSQHIPLRVLILQNNGLGPSAGAQVAEALTSLAQKKSQARKEGTKVPDLEIIVCGRNRLESGSMPAWSRCLQANSSVREVKMVQNGIRPEGIATLLRDGLGHCEKLEVLDLQDNTFTHVGAGAMKQVLGRWRGLRELGVGDCLVGARGGVLLAEELGKGANKELEVIRGQYNEIDAGGVKALARAAAQMPKLRRVELNGNRFSEDDEAVESLRLLLEERKEAAESQDGEWGLDELSDLEEEDSDEDEEARDEVEADEDSGEEQAKQERILKDADEVEGQNVAEEEDKEVEELADALDKTHV